MLQYDGSDFHGWQVQGDLRTVQGDLENALSLLEGAEVHVAGSGRTDAGVHAEAQVASVKMERVFKPEKLRSALNGNLPWDVRVLGVEEADEDFHARFSAKGKSYVYRVINSNTISPFWSRYAHLEKRFLSLKELYEIMSPGGIIIVDDCGSKDISWDGSGQAYREFMKEIDEDPRIVHGKLGEVKKPFH